MSADEILAMRLRNYKCFSDEGAGFDRILPLNLIIGRNNSGKSSLLELVEYVVRPTDISSFAHRGQTPEVTLTTVLNEVVLRKRFSETTAHGPIPGNHWAFGQKWIGRPITWSLDPSGKGAFVSVDPMPEDGTGLQQFKEVASDLRSPLAALSFKRLRSDRDISAEADAHATEVLQNGEGATTLIRHFLTKSSLSSTVVEKGLLSELNKIFEPDVRFEDITVRQLPDARWEIYLGEAKKGRIPLSQSGSGLKTVLLVLTFLHLVPVIEARPLASYVFGFEELENNLHPALLRRLFLYLRGVAVDSHCPNFVTTHSNVVIDLFGDDDAAQIVHVEHDGTSAKASRALAYVQRRGILDDLDIRASDLLQANGIVWV